MTNKCRPFYILLWTDLYLETKYATLSFNTIVLKSEKWHGCNLLTRSVISDRTLSEVNGEELQRQIKTHKDSSILISTFLS